MAQQTIFGDSVRSFATSNTGSSSGGAGTEFGDTWDIAVGKINAMFGELYEAIGVSAGSGLQLVDGVLSIATAGVTNSMLANSSIILGSTTMSLGNTYSLINGNLSFGGTVNFTGSLEIGGTALSLPVDVANGGTGAQSFTGNGVLYGNGTNALGVTAVNGTSTNKFLTQINGFAPSFDTIQNSDLPSTAVLAVTNDTNVTGAISNQNLTLGWTGTLAFSRLAPISGYSLLGNTGSSSGSAAGFAIGGLTQKSSPASTDLLLLQDQAASGALKYATVSGVVGAVGVASLGNPSGDSTLTVAGTGSGPWTGTVTAKINLANANSWTETQSFSVAQIKGRWVTDITHPDFGADPTGSTDSSSAIQAAVNYAISTYGGGLVVLPPGRYLVKSAIAINGNVVLLGCGRNSTYLDSGDTDTTILSFVTGISELRDITLYGKGYSSVASNTWTAAITNPVIKVATATFFERVNVWGGYRCIEFDGSSSNTIITIMREVSTFYAYGDCQVYGKYLNGWYTDSSSNQSTPAGSITNLGSITTRPNSTAVTAGQIYTVSYQGSTYQIQYATGGTTGASAPNLLPYGQPITDGSAVAYLSGPAAYTGFILDSGSSQNNFEGCDFTGNAFQYNLWLADSLGVGGTAQTQLRSCTPSDAQLIQVYAAVGNRLQITGCTFDGGGSSTDNYGLWFGPSWGGTATVADNLFYRCNDAITVQGGIGLNIAGNQIISSAGIGVHIAAAVTYTSIIANVFGGGSGDAVKVDALAADYYIIDRNLYNQSNSVSDSGTGTHKIVEPNGII